MKVITYKDNRLAQQKDTADITRRARTAGDPGVREKK